MEGVYVRRIDCECGVGDATNTVHAHMCMGGALIACEWKVYMGGALPVSGKYIWKVYTCKAHCLPASGRCIYVLYSSYREYM